MKTISTLVVLCTLTFLTGCTSYFKRQECKKINWFEHGQNVALRGERLNADTTLKECREAEAEISESQLDLGFKSGMQKYCEPAHAYKVGRGGDRYVRDLCEGPTIRQLISQHQKGIDDYCRKDNAYQAGASGKKYGGVCTPQQEKDFLPGYRKGRKRYLTNVIEDKEKLIKEREGSIAGLEREQQRLEWERGAIQLEKSSLEAERSRFATLTTPEGQAHLNLVTNRLNAVDSRLNERDRELRSKRSALEAHQQERESLRKDISEMRAEMASLDEDN